jgi:glycosyltransferase involved in cell wall biosynthesis
MKKFDYVAEINLPSHSAYPLHVLKMCDAFAELNYKVTLYIFYKDNKLNFNKIKKIYNLRNSFEIKSIFNQKKNYSFLDRLKLASLSNKMITEKSLIVSRSIITSIFLAFYKKKNSLEIHHQLQGLTYLIFKFRNFFINEKFLNFILIHKNLIKKLYVKSGKSIILDDAVDINNFKKIRFKETNQCVYTGSLLRGKGIEVIKKLADLNPKIKFNIYGDINDLASENVEILKKKNMNFNNHVNYFQIPKILSKHRILLMPYQKKVFGIGKNLELSQFMSPMKMFDYLASGKIILASKLKVYEHVLKNNINSFLVHSDNINQWNYMLRKIFYSKNQYKNIRNNALKTATKYTWVKRVQKIIRFNKI